MERDTFRGFVRPDGSVGIRNYVAVIPTVSCANGVAANISKAVPGAVPFLHGHGCGRAIEISMHTRALIGLGINPNVAAVLVVGLGCETVQAGTASWKTTWTSTQASCSKEAASRRWPGA